MMRLVIGNKNYSSWSLRPWLAMRHLGLDFEEVVIPLDQPGTAAAIRRHSGAGRVPVLVDGDLTVWESLAIIEYLAEVRPELWPVDRKQRAQARAYANEMHGGFSSLRNLMPMNVRARGRRVAMTAALLADIARIEAIWSACLASGGPWLFGDFTACDAMFAPVVWRFNGYEVALTDASRRYMQQAMQHPAMVAWATAAAAEPWTIAQDEAGDEAPA